MFRSIKSLSIFLVVLMIGCSSHQKWPATMESLEIKEVPEFTLTGKIGENLGLKKPTSILGLNNLLYITDTENDRIVVSDLEGNFIRSIGETGNGPLQFIKPTGITSDNSNHIYVVDSGNNRIQIINQDDQFIQQFRIMEFPYRPNIDYLNDIAWKDGSIYVTTQTMDPSWGKVIVIAEDGSMENIGESIVGHIVNAENEILFASEGEFKQYKKGRSFESGRNYLIKMTSSNEMGAIIELPYQYTAKDIRFHNGELYLLSRLNSTIDRFDVQGNYISTPYRFKADMDELMGIDSFTFAGNDIFVLNAETNDIYHLKRNPE